MDEPHLNTLPLFNTIGMAEKLALKRAMRAPLSGYLGGVDTAGYWIERLQDSWRSTFKVKHAVACNSATSGLLAACMAIGVGPGDTVWTSAYSMSATAACAKVLGARIVFIDIEMKRFSMNMNMFRTTTGSMPKCVIVTNLFGHPAYLTAMRSWCDSNKVILIEDNAQSPFATENGRYAGTVGHIGVFSLNVHKHIQCGEGGVVVTNDDSLALAVRGAINHGELARRSPGLNLRMTEPIATIACAQLKKAKPIIRGRCDFALELSYWFRDIDWIVPPLDDWGCKHVYYVWAARVESDMRQKLVVGLNKHGFPMKAGYVTPLNKLFIGHLHNSTAEYACPVTEKLENEELITFEICRYDPIRSQRRKMEEIVKRVTGKLNEQS